MASTGDVEFIDKSSTESSGLKGVSITQKNVHDFAWFADKNFKIKEEKFKLPSGRECTAYAYYTPANEKKYENAAKVLAETTKFLSKEVGEYPYKQISIVDGPLYAGGGMEYPNIAIIGNLPSQSVVNIVIVHEAGHNWFQGILGSNERVHPWLDEGVNSFYEAKVVEHLKSKGIPVAASGGNAPVYILNGHIHHNQPIELPAADYTDDNYGGVVYAKAAKSIALLEDYMGVDNFRSGMKQYFKNWKQKHPLPVDLRAALEKNTNQDISWFFTDFIKNHKPLDYKITSMKREGANNVIRVKDRYGSNYPIPVFAMSGETILEKNYTQNGVAYFKDYEDDVTYSIDKENVVPEINKLNNNYKPTGLFKRKKPSIGLGTSILKPGINKAYLQPAFGFNHYDRWQVGVVFHNLKIPNSQFQFAFAPMFGLGSKQFNGTGVMGYTFYPDKTFYRVVASVQGGSFSRDSTIRNISKAIYPRWYKINPRLRFDLKKKSLRSPVQRTVILNFFHTASRAYEFFRDTVNDVSIPSLGEYERQNLFRLNYVYKNKRTFNPYGYQFQYETTKDISKLTAEGSIKIDYFMPKKALYIRAFAGKFFYLNNEASFFDVAPYFLNVTPTAVNDYAYENTFLGRNEREGYKGQQVMDKEGAFSTRTTYLANPLGRTDDWLAAVNIRTDIPVKYNFLPQVFFNAATFADAGMINTSGSKMLFEGGLQFNLIRDIAKINIPLVLSKDFKDYTQSIYTTNRFVRQISFSLSTDRIDFLRTQETLTKLIF